MSEVSSSFAALSNVSIGGIVVKFSSAIQGAVGVSEVSSTSRWYSGGDVHPHDIVVIVDVELRGPVGDGMSASNGEGIGDEESGRLSEYSSGGGGNGDGDVAS